MLARSARTLIAAPLALLALVPATLGGCGSTSPAQPDPATVVPAGAALYIGAVVKPSGSLQSDTKASLGKLTHSGEPFAGLLGLLSPAGRRLRYATDVKPWLGTRAGAFVGALGGKAGEALLRSLGEGLTGAGIAAAGEGALRALLASGAAEGAIVLDTSDAGRAKAFLQERSHEAGGHTASYKGVGYEIDGRGEAAGMVGAFAVIGSEGALHAVIDTEQAGASGSLAQAGDYAKLSGHAEAGALAGAYVHTAAVPSLGGLFGGARAAYLTLLPAASAVTLDVDTLASTTAPSGQSATGLLPSAASAQFVEGLPGGSWLALGVGDAGATFKGSVSTLRSLAQLASGVKVGSYSLQGLFAPLLSPTSGLDVERDLLSWMGAAGVFASGSGLLDLQAGLVAAANDPARARAAVGRLAAAYRATGAQVAASTIAGAETAVTVRIGGFPVLIDIGAGNGRFAIGLGPASVQEALSPASRLGESPAYRAAASMLGHGLRPSALVEFPTLLGLIETLGAAQSEGVSTLVPYLQSLSTLAGGGGESLGEGVTRARLVLGLQ